jgi:hypothetical protein
MSPIPAQVASMPERIILYFLGTKLIFRRLTVALLSNFSPKVENLMKNVIKSLVGCALVGGVALSVHAAEDASATLTPLSGSGPFTYQLTLTDTGTTPIGSVWYSWTPTISPFDYLPSLPSSAPVVTTGWSTSIQGSAGAASIQFVAGAGDALQPGQSASFDFTTADSPPTLAGNDSEGTPIGTSVAYSGALFSDGGHQFVATSAPEPSTWALLGMTAVGWFIMRRRRVAA